MTKPKIKTKTIECKMPEKLADAIDKFLKLDVAKQNGIFSQSNFITRVVAQWFVMVRTEFDIDLGITQYSEYDIPFIFPED